jgi:hypothetical protein
MGLFPRLVTENVDSRSVYHNSCVPSVKASNFRDARAQNIYIVVAPNLTKVNAGWQTTNNHLARSLVLNHTDFHGVSC